MDKRLLDILCCPVTKAPLRMLTDIEVAALNRAIAANGVHNGVGATVGRAIPVGLITSDGRTIYRIEDDIPVMLADESIGTGQLADFPHR